MNPYRCAGCDSNIIDGQPVVLTTVVMSVEYQRLGDATIYHERCYPSRGIVEEARKALFEDAALSDDHRMTRLTRILGTD